MTFLGVAGYGFSRAGNIRKRYEELLYIKRIILMLRGEINYNLSSMSEVFHIISLRLKEPYKKIFYDFAVELDKHAGVLFYEIWKEKVIKPLGTVIGCERDLDRLLEMGENLGFLDKEMQMNYIDLFLENFNQSLREKQEKVQNEEKLNKMMGVLGGIFLVVFLW